MKQTTISANMILFLCLAFYTMVFTACKKDSGLDSKDFGNAPRKEVPDPFVGEFMYVTSTDGYVDQYGHQIPGVS